MSREAAFAPDSVRVNGRPDLEVSPLDRALHFGDGLFETVACCRGHARFLPLHLERLLLGCQRLQIDPGDPEALAAEVRTVAAEAERSIVKVIVTRGTAVARGYGFTGREKATRITLRYAWPQETAALSGQGVRVRTANLRLGENPALAGLKHCNRLEQVLARREWTDPDIAEALLYSSSGKLISGTMSNVFVVEGSRLHTPRVDTCGVAGVMRRVVMREATLAGVSVEESVLDAAALERADEIFLTNARIGIWPLRALDDRTLRPGPITRRLQERLAPLLEDPTDA
ncbi:MAG TPA: aminodeoxychorismate lyase [Steroidobacteraceae bacterium]|nr:aminodeoxychorismate lyase [Steroidobacteraceae bacterium]